MPIWTVSQSREPELMDDPALAESEHFHALAALNRINVVSRTAAQLARAVSGILVGANAALANAPAVIADVACGGGDVTVELALRLSRNPDLVPVAVVGLDISPRAIERSRALAERLGCDARFAPRDVLAEGCPPCDVAVSSLFLHHLDDASAVALLRGLASTVRVGIVVSDLIRSPLGLALAVLGTTFLSTSRVARVDGPLSVRAARTPAEYRVLCDAAGLRNATIRQAWPERVVITWTKVGLAAKPKVLETVS